MDYRDATATTRWQSIPTTQWRRIVVSCPKSEARVSWHFSDSHAIQNKAHLSRYSTPPTAARLAADAVNDWPGMFVSDKQRVIGPTQTTYCSSACLDGQALSMTSPEWHPFQYHNYLALDGHMAMMDGHAAFVRRQLSIVSLDSPLTTCRRVHSTLWREKGDEEGWGGRTVWTYV